MYILTQDKGTFIALETGRDIPRQGDKPCLGSLGSFSWVMQHSRPEAHSYTAE